MCSQDGETASITDRKPAASDEGTRRVSQPEMPGIAKGAARPPWPAPAQRRSAKHESRSRAERPPPAPFNPLGKYPRGKRWASLNAQRQPTRPVPPTRRVPKATPQCAPSAGPSAGGVEAGKPSGGRRKGDPRHGRRVAPGRRRSHQSEGLSRQFGKAVGLLRAAASALNPPPPNGRWAIRHGRPRAERPPRESFSSRPAGGHPTAADKWQKGPTVTA